MGALIGGHFGWRMTFAGVGLLSTLALIGLTVGVPKDIGTGFSPANLRDRLAAVARPGESQFQPRSAELAGGRLVGLGEALDQLRQLLGRLPVGERRHATLWVESPRVPRQRMRLAAWRGAARSRSGALARHRSWRVRLAANWSSAMALEK